MLFDGCSIACNGIYTLKKSLTCIVNNLIFLIVRRF